MNVNRRIAMQVKLLSFWQGLRLLNLRFSVALAFLIVLMSGSALAGDDAPQWLKQAVAISTRSYEKNVPAVVLLKEQNVKVDEDGRVTASERFAIRILSKEGRGEAVAAVHYLTDTGKVRDMRGWVIRPSEEVKKLDKDSALDLAAAPNDVFNDVRVKVLSARDEVEPGAVFGCEWISEDRSIFTQFEWQFQERLPVVVSRFTITLSAGWRAEAVMLNHAKIEPTVSGTTYSWELRDLPYIEEEPLSPPVTNIAPRLAVSYFPPPDKKAGNGKTFSNWADVSRWLTELSEPQASIDDAMANKAKQLTANAKTELDRIRAIGRYVQGVNYVSIQTGIGRGGGYRPHAATDVFAKSYGDCKDKANLMRAMLKAIGIQSYLVSIYSGDASYVREEWPSPQQFNHCIIAIKVNDDTQAATIIKHPSLGRLLIFDPTDDNTPVGDLPDGEQGSLALIIAGDAGALLRMPKTEPETNRLERLTEVELDGDGVIKAIIHERSAGQSAVSERSRFRRLAQPEYVKMIEEWITRGASGAEVSKIEPSDKLEEGKFSLDVEFTAPRYGQLMQSRLLVFKPAIVSHRDSLFLTEPSRRQPVVLEPHAYTETVKVKLPAGFDIDEIPDAVKLDAPFGSYKTSYEVKDGQLLFTRSLVVQGAKIDAGEYAKVRGFYEKIRAAEQAPVVLVKK